MRKDAIDAKCDTLHVFVLALDCQPTDTAYIDDTSKNDVLCAYPD
jgi:hypothetical protein